jgi:protein gp37
MDIGFAPALRPERITAPYNSYIPKRKKGDGDRKVMPISDWDKNVFTCSMADLFGKWVPQPWIDSILDVMRDTPQWNYLCLTKFPQRLSEQDWPKNTWVGATVDTQSRVDLTVKAFTKLKASGYKGITWLSLEPLLEPLKFDSLEMFDMVVVGGASKSSQTPEFWPPIGWIIDIMIKADQDDVAIYLKENAVKELPFRRADYGIDKAPWL